MGKRTKLEKFAENLKFPNVFENKDFKEPELYAGINEKVDFKGKWATLCFKNENPIGLELACGRGEYSLGLGKLFPNRNFIGVDIKGARIWQGAKFAQERELNNIAFVRTKIELIPAFFAKAEIEEIWITFPDPFLKHKKSNRRLTSINYLNLYYDLLKPNGLIYLKTDDETLYDFTLKTIKSITNFELLFAHDDIYSLETIPEEWKINTYYERMHLLNNKKIKIIKIKKK